MPTSFPDLPLRFTFAQYGKAEIKEQLFALETDDAFISTISTTVEIHNNGVCLHIPNSM